MNCGPKYATQDIVCYKVLYKGLYGKTFNGIYYSPYKFFKYKLNERVSSDFDFASLPLIKMSPQKEYKFLRILTYFRQVNKGLHSFKYLIDAHKLNNRFIGGTVMKCIIPKGSWYYEGIGDELVSDNIIIIEEVRTFDESFYYSRIK